MYCPCTKAASPKEITGQGKNMKKVVKAVSGELKSMATQANLWDPEISSSYALNLITKCKELKVAYDTCFRAIDKDKEVLDQSENRLTQIDAALANICPKVEQLNSQILTENVAKAGKAMETEKVRRELATLQRRMLSHISKLGESPWSTQQLVTLHQEREQAAKGLQEVKDDRALLERKLFKVNNDIDATYEDLFEDDQRLDSIKVLIWEAKRDHVEGLEKIKLDAEKAKDRKKQILAVTGKDPASLNLSGMYVNPNQLKLMQQELVDLRDKQNTIEMQIQAQKEEKEFMKSINEDLMDKVKDIESRVKPEALAPKKDRPVDFKWRQDLGGPKIWFVSPILTVDQLKGFLDQRYGKYACASELEGSGASTSSSSDHVVGNTYVADVEMEEPSG